MTQTVYLFDPHGVDAKCLISNESRAVPALGGRFRCIIPSAAPFYRKGAVVKVGARVLKEGVDFYFGHQYIRGTHQTAQMIYGSILILDATVTTPVTLSYQTLGGQYTVTDARIAQYLANELTDPIAASWESVMGNDLYFPPVDIAYDIDNWSGENELKAELSRIADAIRNQEPLESEEYDLYDRWILEQQAIIDDSLWAEHLANGGGTDPGPIDNTIVSLNLKQLVYDDVDYDLAAKFMLVTPRSPGFFPHFYSNGIESWSSMSAETMSQYIWTFADQDTAERVSSIYKDERGFWKKSFLDVRPGTGMVSGYQFTNYHAVWELCAGHMAPLPPYNSPDGQPVLIPGQYGSVELVLVHAPNKDGPMPAILLTITDTWFDDKQSAVITLQSYYREVTIFSQAISGALHYGTKFRVTVDLTDTPDMADGLWLPDALAVVVTAVYPDNHLTEVMNTTLTYNDLGGLRDHLYSNQGVHTGIAEYNAYNPTTKLIQFTFDTHSSNTTTGGVTTVIEPATLLGGWAINSSNFPGVWNNFNTSVGVVYGVSSLYDYMFSSVVVVYDPSVDPSSYTTELQGLAFDNIHEGWEASADIDIGGQSYIFEHDYGDRVNFMSTPDDIVNYMEFALKCNGFDMPDQSQYLAFRFEPQGLLSNGALSLWTHDGGLIEQLIYSDPAQVLPLGSKFDSMGTVSVKWGENDTEYYIQLSYASEGTPYELRVPKSVVTDAVGEFGIGPYGIGAQNVPNIGVYNLTFKYANTVNTSVEAEYVLDGGIINSVGVGFYLGQESNRPSWVWQYSETPNLYDPSYWGEEYMMTGPRGVILNSDFYFLDSNTLFFDSTIPGYTQQYAGVYSENTYGFFSLTTYVSGGAANVQLIEQIGQCTFDLGGNEPGIAAIVLKDDQVGPAGNQLSVIIDPYDVIGSGSISVWYNFRTNTETCLGFSNSFYNEPVSWDTLGEIKVVAKFLPDGIEVSVDYGVDYAQNKSLTVPMDVVTMVVALDQILLSNIGVGGMMQPKLCFADTVVEEYTYVYQQGTAPVVTITGDNPHNTRWYEAGALKSDGVAQNADKLSNLTKDQLADYVNARQGVATTGLFPLTGNRILTGDLVLQDGLANLSRYAQDTGENESFLQLSTGNITLNGDRNVTIQADKDKNHPGTAATMEAGVNVLKVVSSGGALEKDKLLFNNQQVLTTETLKDHLPTDANATVNISYANGGGLTFSGKGSSVDPLKVNVSLPDGSLTKVGLMQLTSALDNSAPGTAATPYAIKKLNDQLADLVPTTRKINGYPLSANVRITTTNLGLDHVDNTTDAAKPVNSNHRALLNQYNVIVHEHTASDFSMNIATTAVAGLVIYSDVVSSDTTHALMSTAVSMLDTTADENDRYLYTKVPVTATDIVRYGDAGYLPIPVVGSYPAAGVNASSLSTVGEIEADGTLVCLRNGSDVSESGVYYTYATFNADGSIKKVTPTTTKYTPDYLPANDSMLWVTRGTEGVFVIRSLLGKHYIVLTNGTMESRYHVGSEITTSLTHGWQLMPIIVGQYVYLINHNYANTEYAFSAWRCLRSDIGKGPVAFTQLTFTGTDAFGNVQTAVTRFNLVPGGISTDPTAKIQAIDLSGGVWTTRNLRHANCNYDMVAEGNKVRVATYVSMYLANSTRSVWSHYSTGYVIDFDTMTATLDTPDGFPIKFDANGVITTSLRQGNESIGFPRASASNQTGVIRSRGKTISYMFYGSEYIPNIGAFKYTVGTSEFDQLNTNTSQSVSIGSALYFNGNYGSVLGSNQRGIHLISGNRYVAYQADGTYVQAEYDLNSTYVVGDLGYGPTVNRKTITPAQHLAYTHTIHTVDAAGVAVNDGYVFSDNALSGPSKIIGETLTNTVSITATAFNALKANFFAQLGVGTPDATTRFINAKLSVYVATSPDYPTVAFYSYRVYSDDTLTASVVKYIIATVTLDSRSAITSAVLNAVIKSGTSSPSITFLNDPSQAYGGSTFAKLADGNVLLILQSHSNYGTVGGSALNAALLIYNPTTSTWIRSDTFGTAQYVAAGYFYTKEQGIFSAWRHATGEAVMINRRGFTSASFATGSSTTAIFTATRVATGWLIYFTEPVVYFCDGVKYTLPVQNLDVRTFFPGEYQNQTMYLYVTLIAGVPTYTMSLTHVEDTPTATYIGYCTTDSNKVTALSVERATRLGLFRELQAHLNDSDAHGTGSATLASIGLPLLENKAPHYELKTDLFGEVYNSWTRFSHWPTDYNMAAYPGEVNAWTFDASADTVRCTQNTVGYSGFVSLDAVGDFTFDTVVGVKPTSTDGDNDAITLVIAFKTEDGKQHDISVVRSRSIEAHIKVDTMFGVYYDYMGPEQTKIASVLTTTSESPGMWRGYYARIRVVRVGDNYTVLSTPVSNTVDWSAAIDSDFIFAINFTLNDLPALAKFKGPTRYGYGAVSQIDASYINYLRPDEDGRNYYATAIEAIKAADWQSRMSVTSGTVTNGGILPVPAGYDATECRWFLSPRLVNGTPPAGKGMMSYTMSYNASRVVTATSTYEDGTIVPNIVYYQCLAVKGIKLFK